MPSVSAWTGWRTSLTSCGVSQAVQDRLPELMSILRPPPDLTISQWADQNRVLSPEASAEPGKWSTARVEYSREIMDTITDITVEEVIVMGSSQVGKTEIELNTLGYYIEHDPSPILVVYPTITIGKDWSKDRLDPMLRDTPCLRNRIAPARRRDSGNTVLHKRFRGGHVTIAGANSPASLSSRPVRVVLADEIDRFPRSAGDEGDPVSLAYRRTETFWNRRLVAVSTPTIEGQSAIADRYEQTDKRVFEIPCHACGELHEPQWEQVTWDHSLPIEDRAASAAYHCPGCGSVWTDAQRWAAVRQGRWRATAPFRGRAGFRLNALLSPWVSVRKLVAEWLKAEHDVEKRKQFVNTMLGRCWREKGEAPAWERLYERREEWPQSIVPQSVLFLTCGVDVQGDRLEARVWGWGRDKRSWLIDRRIIVDDRSRPAEAWDELERLLETIWHHESGADLRLVRMAVDSGYRSEEVYRFVRRHGRGGRVLAIKGDARGAAALGLPRAVDVTRTGKARGVKVWPVSPSPLKEQLYRWLNLARGLDGETPPAGYVHLPTWAGDDELRQLTAEEQMPPAKRKGGPEWNLLPGRRNEALDCRVYAHAAAIHFGMERFTPQQWDELEGSLTAELPLAPRQRPKAESETARPVQATDAALVTTPPAENVNRVTGRRRGGWLSR